MNSKTIILSSPNSKGRGILTFFFNGELLECKLRLYNAPKLSVACRFAVYHNKQVYSANLIFKQGAFLTSLVGDFDMSKDFFVAIIDTQNNNQVLLSGGTYSGYFSADFSVFDELVQDKPILEDNDNLRRVQDDLQAGETTMVETENQQAEAKTNPDKTIDYDCNKCAHCKYKEFFYSFNENNNNSTDVDNETLENSTSNNKAEFATNEAETARVEEKNSTVLNSTDEAEKQNAQDTTSRLQSNKQENKAGETDSLLASILPQFDYIFSHFDLDLRLQERLPNSKFAKVKEGKDNYSIGVIYSGDEVKFLCYAVFANYSDPVPSELGEHYQWLPLDMDDPLSDGYYLVFQDANNLNIVG